MTSRDDLRWDQDQAQRKRAERMMRALWLAQVKRAQQQLSLGDIETSLANGEREVLAQRIVRGFFAADPQPLMKVADVVVAEQTAFRNIFAAIMAELWDQARKKGIKRALEDLAAAGWQREGYKPDRLSQAAITFNEEQGGLLVTAVTAEQQEAVQFLVTESFKRGTTYQHTARMIRAQVGLRPDQIAAWHRRRDSMMAQGIPMGEVDRHMKRYAEQQHRHRADMIARTETLTAQSNGRRDGWREARQGGLMPPGVQKEWLAAVGSNRTCSICIGLDGQRADLDGTYPGGSDGPPGHVGCRCTERLIIPTVNDSTRGVGRIDDRDFAQQ